MLNDTDQGEPHGAEELLRLVYDELRNLTAQRLADEKPGETLSANRVVHETLVHRLDVDTAKRGETCDHFIATADEALGRIFAEVRLHPRTMMAMPGIEGRAAGCEEPGARGGGC